MADPELNQLWSKILNVPIEFSNLLKDTALFNEVLRGFPEDYKNFSGNIATVNFAKLIFPTELPMSDRNRPKTVKTVVGLIAKGTRTEVHDFIVNNTILIGSYFEENENWITLNGTVRNTKIIDHIIKPELVGKQLQTSSIFTFEHDVRWRR